jgi:3-oxoacyl-ACP reductase-like protein
MKKLTLILAAGMVALGTGAVYLWQQLEAERSLNAALNDRVMALEVAQQALALRPPPAPAAPAETPPAAAAAPAPATPAPAGTGQAAANNQGNGLAAVAKEMLSTKAGQDMTRSLLRNVLVQQYPDLGKELGLTPEQVNEFFDLATRQQMELSADSMDLVAGGASPEAMQELQRKTQEKQQANEAEIAAMLGSKYPQFQEYQGTMAARQQVNQLQTALGSSGITSLTDSQKQGLITALGAEQKRITQENLNAPAGARRGNQNYLEQQLEQNADKNRRMVDAASAYLNSQQLDSYKKMLDQQQEMISGLARAMGGTQGAAPAPR